MNKTPKESAPTQKPMIVAVDDEQGVEIIFSQIVADQGFSFQHYDNVEKVLTALKNGLSPSVIFLDIQLPGMDGVSAISEILKIRPSVRIVMMTAYQTVESVVASMKSGAADYLTKPLDSAIIIQALEKYGKATASSAVNPFQIPTVIPDKLASRINKIVACSPEMKGLLSMAEKFAAGDAPVLILGESGTGKELLAHYIHNNSERADHPLEVVDCSSIPETLFESELFGHEKGAFTGADSAKSGRFELAHKGTIFLDEIGNVPMSMQAKLLRFTQDHILVRLGGHKNMKLDIRLIAATNENPRKLIEKGLFREDLYYRLSALALHLPSLRNRSKEEKECLIKYFILKCAKILNLPQYSFSEEAHRAVMIYPWPGNIRELENAIYSAYLLTDTKRIAFEHLPIGVQSFVKSKEAMVTDDNIARDTGAHQSKTLRQILSKVEKEQILSVLKETGGNKKKAAEILDMDYKNLLEKLKKYTTEKTDIGFPGGTVQP